VGPAPVSAGRVLKATRQSGSDLPSISKRHTYRWPGSRGIGAKLSAIGKSIGVPALRPAGLPTSKPASRGRTDEQARRGCAACAASGDGMIEPHYKTSQVAKALAVNPETVRRLAARGKLRFVRVEAELRFPESASREYLDRQAGQPA
jgi:excisionase family DNA binding protein